MDEMTPRENNKAMTAAEAIAAAEAIMEAETVTPKELAVELEKIAESAYVHTPWPGEYAVAPNGEDRYGARIIGACGYTYTMTPSSSDKRIDCPKCQALLATAAYVHTPWPGEYTVAPSGEYPYGSKMRGACGSWFVMTPPPSEGKIDCPKCQALLASAAYDHFPWPGEYPLAPNGKYRYGAHMIGACGAAYVMAPHIPWKTTPCPKCWELLDPPENRQYYSE
jgi:hypothetical protein